MLLSALTRIPPLSPTTTTPLHHHNPSPPSSSSSNRAISLRTSAASALKYGTPQPTTSLENPSKSLNVSPVSHVDLDERGDLISSASAVSVAIRRVSSSPVEFAQRIDKADNKGLVLPSQEFQRLCAEQLDLFTSFVDQNAVLSVYVRPAGNYVMDRLELRRVALYPGVDLAAQADIVVLTANFIIPTGLRAAEAGLSKQHAEDIPECRAVVLPMVKDPFLVGFLVAELPLMEATPCINAQQDPSSEESSRRKLDIQPYSKDSTEGYHLLTVEQKSRAVKISRSLAMAYVLDQKTLLLQQSSWQNNIRMSNLVDQIRGPLSSIRTLSKMLSVHMKKSEISFDIVEDILVQGDRVKDTLQKLQDAVYLTKANIVRYNDESQKKMRDSNYGHTDRRHSQSSNVFSWGSHGSEIKDLEIPMPPLALAALQQHNIRPCNVSNVLADLVGAAGPLAEKQQRSLEFRDLSQSLQVAIEEAALRQALSNLIEGALLRTHVSGRVEIVSIEAPGGGVLVLVDDNGPDMHYMTQMHSLAPFGADLFSEGMVEDNMTWNFIAGLTVAREILESYGCVVRVISPHLPDAPLGSGGTRVELWLPAFLSDDSMGPNKKR